MLKAPWPCSPRTSLLPGFLHMAQWFGIIILLASYLRASGGGTWRPPVHEKLQQSWQNHLCHWSEWSRGLPRFKRWSHRCRPLPEGGWHDHGAEEHEDEMLSDRLWKNVECHGRPGGCLAVPCQSQLTQVTAPVPLPPQLHPPSLTSRGEFETAMVGM